MNKNAWQGRQYGHRIALGVDTSSPEGGAAILRGSEIIACVRFDGGRPHSNTLFEGLQQLVADAGIEFGQVEIFSVVTGPGGFTGLRVGISSLSGMARACGRQLVGVSAFDAWAYAAGVAGEIAIVLEAGRGQHYFGLRKITRGVVETLSKDSVLDDSTAERLLLGEGLRMTPKAGRIGQQLSERLALAGADIRCERADTAAAAARLASARMMSGEAAAASPYYIRPADARAIDGK
ncbi:MAG: tRNA (adenosine(37)-N6)-threonylcarbamoyltransferase complex dimerization subunit type 1 TsaB [Acidobacteria bacterium]|nr:tRNA (adenosine(37)-N6)-threonylcarbamoyltransferase complex dimerization subunit type 1 TsaB [Acidobacteriota bacterium]MCW5967066.1 tRNA (adenosine(37)-N6)-threonylcarbamoyltransferase complex dimerization subunit type 1 TsaB [Blastocatellales bacterium]